MTSKPEFPTVRVNFCGGGKPKKIAIVTIDNPPVNAGSVQVRGDLLAAFAELTARDDIRGVVLTGENGNFVAGSDIREFGGPPLAPHLPEVIAAIENFPTPVVAAIDGAALGGGYELALGCDARVATPASVVGLPEVTLGLIPGAGGTYRLPRLVGKAEAIALITSGRRVKASEALRMRMIDQIAEGDPIDAAIDLLIGDAGKKPLRQRPLPEESEDTVRAAEAAAMKAARGAVAVAAAIAAVRASDGDADAALAAERETSLRLRREPQGKALQHLFFAERAAAKVTEGVTGRRIATVGICGAGRMGTGIALAFAGRGFTTRMVEQDGEVAAASMATIDEQAGKMHALGRIASPQTLGDRITFGKLEDLAECDLVVEAITENMEAKKGLFAALVGIVGEDAILASNTSYLDLDEIASSLANPARVAGLHFFNPANVMKLVEIVRGRKTAPDVVATLLSLCRKLGKVPVVARVGEGFIGNRIFMAYRAQCEFLLEEGCLPQDVDAAMRDFGMAMGPFAVFDLAGLDIAWATRKRLAPTRPANARYVTIADTLCEQGRFGRRTGRGWYDYASGKPRPDPDVERVIVAASQEKGLPRRKIPVEEIQRRLLAAIVNEACLVLSEKIAERPGDIDLALVHGYGFPALKGGPLHWAARQPRGEIITAIDDMIDASGPTARKADNLDEVLKSSENL